MYFLDYLMLGVIAAVFALVAGVWLVRVCGPMARDDMQPFREHQARQAREARARLDAESSREPTP